VDSSNNRVGIGTSSPDKKLSLGGVTNNDGIRIISSNDTNKNYIFFGDTSSSTQGRILYDHDGDDLSFWTDNSQAMRIDSSGNVGIGTSSPGAANGTLVIGGVSTTNNSGQGSISFQDGGNNGHTRIRSYRGQSFRHGELAFEVAQGTVNSYVEAMRIDSSGNVGIGTSSPSEALDVTGTATVDGLVVDTGGSNTDIGYVRINGGGASGQAQGQMGVGFSPIGPGATNIHASIEAVEDTPASFRTDLVFKTNPLNSDSAPLERLRIDSSGNVLVGTTTTNISTSTNATGTVINDDGLVEIGRKSATLICNRVSGTGGNVIFRQAGNTVGDISVTTTTTSYNTTSDERLKENIADAQSASDLIDGIQVREFDWKADGEHQRYGMIAQELETVAPEAVTKGETEDDMWSVDYSKLVPMLVKEIQDLRKRVAELET
jgi:hypothetical protein